MPENWGPNNPHPLSTRQTELVWEGKYDEYGNRRQVDVAGLAMPLQKIETVDEPRQRLEPQGAFDFDSTHHDDFRNLLIWGDNKLVMASLLEQFRGQVDLIYIDPPFDVGADFRMDVLVGDDADAVGKDQSLLEMIAYNDTWGRGADSYVHHLAERLVLLRDLLSQGGLLLVHLAPTVAHLIRLVAEEIFGAENFRNEIVVPRPISKNLQRQFATIAALPQGHDTILVFSKDSATRLRTLLLPYETAHPDGHWHRFWSGADRPTMRYPLLGENPKSGQWKWKQERAEEAVRNYEHYLAEGEGRSLVAYWRETGGDRAFIRRSSTGTVENWIPPQDDKVGDTVWSDVKSYENVKDFPTQKHVDLLTRIVEWCSSPGDLVADFFCGSGTTLAVAEKLGRRWIGCDLGRFAIHTSRKRLIGVQRELHEADQPYRSFDVYNLGRYERQWWQQERLQGADQQHRDVVLKFFRAESLASSPSPLLHGRKGVELIHVDAIDGLFTRAELQEVIAAATAAGARQVACLAWEFEMDLRLKANELEQEHDLKIRLMQIPREIMEANRTEPPSFFEIGYLAAEPVYRTVGRDRQVDIKLTDFLPSLAEVPRKELDALEERALESGFDFIDFWAIDFDSSPTRPFQHHWQAYRTRKERSLPTVSDCGFTYPGMGTYTACVKVIDVFGADTSTLVEIEVTP